MAGASQHWPSKFSTAFKLQLSCTLTTIWLLHSKDSVAPMSIRANVPVPLAVTNINGCFTLELPSATYE
uniref:Uncharacterized protein n=1 Tax=Romanomermis culicivorax TaxID=13658 RepID=A0A915JUJ8_ROMCU